MSEIARIAGLLSETSGGEPYYGPSVLGALEGVTTQMAYSKPRWSAHSIGELVLHLTAELNCASAVIDGTAGPWIAGETSWPTIVDRSAAAWQEALYLLKKANRTLVSAVEQLADDVREEQPVQVRGPFYIMLHGTVQHNAFHAGQISLLSRQNPDQEPSAARPVKLSQVDPLPAP